MNDYKELIVHIATVMALEDECGQKELADMLEKAADAIEQLVRERDCAVAEMKNRKTQWISVKDRLPETIKCAGGGEYSEAVIVWTTDRKVVTAIYNGKEFIGDYEFWEADEVVTHWAPIPMPVPEQEGAQCD